MSNFFLQATDKNQFVHLERNVKEGATRKKQFYKLKSDEIYEL